MKLTLFLAIVFSAVSAAGEDWRVTLGRQYYRDAEFRRAAGRFEAPCKLDGDPDACHWAGLSYERLADTRGPFGCRTGAKARPYLADAMKLAPDQTEYRDALFEYLLNRADCSRGALRDAAGMLAAIPESDSSYHLMRTRLEDARRRRGSADERLGRLFLPRAGSRAASTVGAVLTEAPKEPGSNRLSDTMVELRQSIQSRVPEITPFVDRLMRFVRPSTKPTFEFSHAGPGDVNIVMTVNGTSDALIVNGE